MEAEVLLDEILKARLKRGDVLVLGLDANSAVGCVTCDEEAFTLGDYGGHHRCARGEVLP